MYRPEAIAYASDRLSGDVVIAVPLAWRSVGWLIFGAVVAGLAFLSLASYSRVETVTGVIVPAAGVSPVIAPRSGVITGLPVREGQQVSAGAILAGALATVLEFAGDRFSTASPSGWRRTRCRN